MPVWVGSGFPSRPKTTAPTGIFSLGSEMGRSVGETSGFPTGVAVAPRRRAARERIWMTFMIVIVSYFGQSEKKKWMDCLVDGG